VWKLFQDQLCKHGIRSQICNRNFQALRARHDRGAITPFGGFVIGHSLESQPIACADKIQSDLFINFNDHIGKCSSGARTTRVTKTACQTAQSPDPAIVNENETINQIAFLKEKVTLWIHDKSSRFLKLF
jgi:hypothetical protein